MSIIKYIALASAICPLSNYSLMAMQDDTPAAKSITTDSSVRQDLVCPDLTPTMLQSIKDEKPITAQSLADNGFPVPEMFISFRVRPMIMETTIKSKVEAEAILKDYREGKIPRQSGLVEVGEEKGSNRIILQRRLIGDEVTQLIQAPDLQITTIHKVLTHDYGQTQPLIFSISPFHKHVSWRLSSKSLNRVVILFFMIIHPPSSSRDLETRND